jgi:hypothetical protein
MCDPRRLGGAIVGGGPHSRRTSIIDPRNAVLVDHIDVCLVEGFSGGKTQGARAFVVLSGRVNKTRDQVRTGFLLGDDGVAAIVSELVSIMERAGPDWLIRFAERMIAMESEGNCSVETLATLLATIARAKRDVRGDFGE